MNTYKVGTIFGIKHLGKVNLCQIVESFNEDNEYSIYDFSNGNTVRIGEWVIASNMQDRVMFLIKDENTINEKLGESWKLGGF